MGFLRPLTAGRVTRPALFLCTYLLINPNSNNKIFIIMRKRNLLLTLVALSLATSSLWAKPAVADENGKLPSLFTVRPCGEQVYFSQGNLQYRASADGTGTDLTHNVADGGTAQGIWRFAEHQYDFVGKSTNVGNVYENDEKCRNEYISSTYTGWIDLIGWGNSGYNSKYPYTATEDIADFGPSSGSIDETYYDWGLYNAISNGGNQPGLWRTLSRDEWSYLLNTRSASTVAGVANARYVQANLFGTQFGVIIFPDIYVHPSGVEDPVNINTWSGRSYNQYSLEDWEKMEAAGAVYLPQTERRYRTDMGEPGCCYYWTSTRQDATHVNSSLFYWGSWTFLQIGPNLGCAVRLVKDAPYEQKKASVATPPTAKIDLIYTGSNQRLVNDAGTATGGTVMYKLNPSESWTTYTSDLFAKNAGTYTVQWFVKANNSGCYSDSEEESLEITIARKSAGVAAPSPMPTVDAASLTYDGTAQDLVTATGSLQSGYTLVYSTDGTTWSEDIPQGTDAGDYTVYYKFYKGTNEEYVPSPNTINVTIAKADIPGVTLPEATSTIPYDGTPKTLVEIDPVANATIYYKLGDGDWTTTPPTRTDAGDYSVQYKIVPDDEVNYNTIGPNTVTVTILDYPTVYDNADPTTKLTELLNTPSDLKVKRTIYADDEYNTICLPFALDESALAASPLAGFNRLKTFKGAQVTGTAPDLYIDIFVEDATTIEAGVPYLITYPSVHADIVDPVFTGITVSTTEPGNVEADGVTFQGMFAQVHIDPYDAGHTQDYLFVGANSQLMWPSSDQTSSDIKMRGFRAYFIIDRNSIYPALAPKGTRARILDAPKTTTAIDNTSATFGGSEKIIENGILYIIRNGVKYNAQGQIIK